jgi:hypothetical protein
MIKFLSILFLLLAAGCSSSKIPTQITTRPVLEIPGIDLDTVKAGRFDTGTMWTFEDIPLDYFAEEYGFVPSEEWLDNVRLSALRFANYCSASFVSEDGLILTNNHCARESIVEIEKEGEDLMLNGFYAETLEDERRVSGLYVDQLVLIKDVTSEILSELESITNPKERLKKEKELIKNIELKEEEISGLRIRITALYNGGKYSLYGYKRFTDVRAVFSPEHQLGHFGGDEDNFTYPRYNLDCAFFRVYDEGRPFKTKNFLRWSSSGAAPGEAVFVVGNPGSTNRLKTVAQLEYLRDVEYPAIIQTYDSFINIYTELLNADESGASSIEVQLLRYLNSKKAYAGMLSGLRDPVLMQRKKDFEEKFKESVQTDPGLNAKYGELWENIEQTINRVDKYSNEYSVLSFNLGSTPEFFYIASDLVDLADQLNLPVEQRDHLYLDENLEATIETLYPDQLDVEYNKILLIDQIELMIETFGNDHEIVKSLIGSRQPGAAAEYLIENSILRSKQNVLELIDKGPYAILNSDDPFIKYVINSSDLALEIQERMDELSAQEQGYEKLLGRALFEVYGTSIPPDATFTLRISDGRVEGYPYNGTIAPPITTFYGLYDRYYSFSEKDQFTLPERWINPPEEFDLEVPFNFVSTNDIVGGSSGSPVINTNAEIVGVAFDGNIESLPGSFIFRTEKNRTVSVHSAGIIEAISDMYNAVRLHRELLDGKIIYEDRTVLIK